MSAQPSTSKVGTANPDEIESTRDAKWGSGHIPALDGLRGVAILMVLSVHLTENFYAFPYPWKMLPVLGGAGWIGVDLFFVLSGFLITGILWQSRGAPHYFRNFYARRFLRLAPVYYGTLLLIFVILPALLPYLKGGNPIIAGGRDEITAMHGSAHYWLWYFLYAVNILMAIKGDFIYPGHFWSLAVEEHFYLVWPMLMRRLARAQLVKITLGIIAGAFVLRCILLGIISQKAVYALTPCRIDDIALGALIALMLRQAGGEAKLQRIVKIALPVSLSVCLGLVLIYKGWRQYGFFPQTVGYSASAIFFASVLVLVLTRPAIAAQFERPSLRFFGKYSYGIYVIHPLAFSFVYRLFSLGRVSHFSLITSVLPGPWISHPFLGTALDSLGFVTLAMGSTLCLALLSWILIESPALSLKRFFPYEKRNGATGAELVSATVQ